MSDIYRCPRCGFQSSMPDYIPNSAYKCPDCPHVGALTRMHTRSANFVQPRRRAVRLSPEQARRMLALRRRPAAGPVESSVTNGRSAQMYLRGRAA